MDPSGRKLDDHGQNSNQLQQYQPLDPQQWMRQREELRQMKAIIEDAERQMEMGIFSQLQQQQLVPQSSSQQAVPPELHTYSPGLPPLPPLPWSNLQSPVDQETARIVEVENGTGAGSSPLTSNLAMENLAAPQTSRQVYLQGGYTHMNGSQSGPLNAHHPQMGNLPMIDSQQQGQNYDISRPPVVPQRHTITNPYLTIPSTHSTQQSQIRTASASHHLPARQQDFTASLISKGRPNQHATSLTQSARINRQPGLRPGLTSTSHTVIGNSGAPQYSKVPQGLSSQSQGDNLRHSTQTRLHRDSSGNTLFPVSYAIPPGPGQMPLRRSTQQEPLTQLATSGEIALTPGFGPAQAMQAPEVNKEPDSHLSVRTSESGTVISTITGLEDKEVVPSVPSMSSPQRNAVNPVPILPPSTAAPSIAQAQESAGTSSEAHLPALSTLNELLADQDRWTDDASNRILQAVLGTPNATSEKITQDGQQSTRAQEPPLPISHPPSTGNSYIEQTHTRLSPSIQTSDILESHRSSNAVATPVRIPPNASASGSRTPLPGASRMQLGNVQLSRESNGISALSELIHDSDPFTPPPGVKGLELPSSASADRSTLARDIMWALRPAGTKRKRADIDGSTTTESPLAKKSKTVVNEEASSAAKQPDIRRPQPLNPAPQLPLVWTTPQVGQRHGQLPLANYQTFPVHPVPHPQMPVQNAGQQTTQPRRSVISGNWQTYSHLPFTLTSASNHQTVGSSVPLPPKQVRASGSGSISSPPAASKQHVATTVPPARVATSKVPLFLPSSESPPPSIPANSSPSHKPSQKVPFVELGPSLSILKSKVHLAKSRDFLKPGMSSDQTPDGLTDEVEPLFGRPTGVLATASASPLVKKSSAPKPPITYRRSLAQTYVWIPKMSVKDRSRYISIKGKGKVPNVSQNERNTDWRQYAQDDSALVSDFEKRLIRRPCLWRGCHAVVDSAEKLLKHVKIIHGTEAKDELFRCHWTECHSNACYAKSERLIRHLQWHVKARLYCAYKNCQFQTLLTDQLVEHVAVDHRPYHTLQPYAMPVQSRFLMPPIPVETLPAYLSVPLPICARPIAKERHRKVGHWVLQRIFGKIGIRRGAVSAGLPLRSQRLLEMQMQPPSGDILSDTTRPLDVQDDYGFTREEVPTRSFGQLMQGPLVIDEIDVELPDDGIVATGLSGSRSTDDPTTSDGVRVVEEIKASSSGEVGTIVETTSEAVMVPHSHPAAREEIDSREVEELL